MKISLVTRHSTIKIRSSSEKPRTEGELVQEGSLVYPVGFPTPNYGTRRQRRRRKLALKTARKVLEQELNSPTLVNGKISVSSSPQTEKRFSRSPPTPTSASPVKSVELSVARGGISSLALTRSPDTFDPEFEELWAEVEREYAQSGGGTTAAATTQTPVAITRTPEGPLGRQNRSRRWNRTILAAKVRREDFRDPLPPAAPVDGVCRQGYRSRTQFASCRRRPPKDSPLRAQEAAPVQRNLPTHESVSSRVAEPAASDPGVSR
ncbi:hypothetical protein DMENIID0001_116060 [Sergentomyia squamirostris]